MMRWHRHVVDVAMEFDPVTGRLIYDEVIVTVMRQCGKTLGLMTPVMVHRLTKVPHRLGRQRVMFTMHQRDKARAKLEKDIIPLLDEAKESFLRIEHTRAKPGRRTYEWKSSLNNGFEHILFGKGNYLGIDTPGKKAGHSETLDLYAFDEIRFAPDDRVEQGADPTMITRKDRQAWKSSTAGDHESFYMWPLVVAGRELVVDQADALERDEGHPSRTAYFEYSIPDDADLHDRDVWREHHPALTEGDNTGTIDLDDIFAKLERAETHPDESKMDTFRNEYANQWVRTPPLDGDGYVSVVDDELWKLRRRSLDGLLGSQCALGVDVSRDGESASIAVACRAPDGLPQVYVLAFETGTFWIEARLAQLRDTWKPVAVGFDAGGPARAVAPEIHRGAGQVPVVALSGGKYAGACEGFVLAFKEGRAWHSDQAWLTTSLAGATKKLVGRSGWVWDRQTTLADISPVVASTCAMRALEAHEPELIPEPVFVVT